MECIINYGHPHTDGFLVMISPLEERICYTDERFPMLTFYDKLGNKIKEMMPDEATEKIKNGYFDAHKFYLQKEDILRLFMERIDRYYKGDCT